MMSDSIFRMEEEVLPEHTMRRRMLLYERILGYIRRPRKCMHGLKGESGSFRDCNEYARVNGCFAVCLRVDR